MSELEQLLETKEQEAIADSHEALADIAETHEEHETAREQIRADAAVAIAQESTKQEEARHEAFTLHTHDELSERIARLEAQVEALHTIASVEAHVQEPNEDVPELPDESTNVETIPDTPPEEESALPEKKHAKGDGFKPLLLGKRGKKR